MLLKNLWIDQTQKVLIEEFSFQTILKSLKSLRSRKREDLLEAQGKRRKVNNHKINQFITNHNYQSWTILHLRKVS